jgi:transposase
MVPAQASLAHLGVGPLTRRRDSVRLLGTPARFQRGKQIGTYVGMIPSEDSSAGKQRLGHISKQGNSLLRFLLVGGGSGADSSCDASAQEHCQGSDGAPAGDSVVLDVAEWL